MSTIGTARNACADSGAFSYQRHQPEKTLLYFWAFSYYFFFRVDPAQSVLQRRLGAAEENFGGYFSGTSLSGTPPIVAVYAKITSKERLRDTLFVLWFVLVSIKIITLAAFGIDLQLSSALLLIPIAALGHIVGLKVHTYLLQNDQTFRRVIGGVLFVICSIGIGALR